MNIPRRLPHADGNPYNANARRVARDELHRRVARVRPMMLAFIRLLPLIVAVVLVLLTGGAYWHSRRRYLLVWTAVWGVAMAYYLAQLIVVSAEPGVTPRDTFERLGIVATSLGWARSLGLWLGARALVGRGLSRRGTIVVGVCSAIWIAIATATMGTPYAPLLTRMGYACCFFAAATVLLLHRPRTTIFAFAGGALVLLGTQGMTATWLIMDPAASTISA